MPTILSHGGALEDIPDEVWSADMTLKVLILGGTSEARELAQRLAGVPGLMALLSFAGRTQSVADPGVPYRVGGFGGVTGLVKHLEDEGYHALVDATHPFAAQMSRNAARAAELLELPIVRLEGPAWTAVEGDRWRTVPSMAEAAAALDPSPRRVFLSIGRLEVGHFREAPWHEYLIRAVDPFVPPLPRARVITARGPFELADECALLEAERIEVVVSKNSGTPSTYAKIEAARRLRLPVIMVARPSLPALETCASAGAVLGWLEALGSAGAARGGNQPGQDHGAARTKRGV
jgi:precorrin-6A/cobalt-precorrin-6A reductase